MGAMYRRRSRYSVICAMCVVACGRDEGPVELTNIRVEQIGAYRAVVRFETSRETSCFIEFGRTPDALDTRATDPNMEPGTYVLDHEVPLEDLAPSADYYFAATVTDPDGVQYHSSVAPFATSAGLPIDSLTNVALRSMGASITAVSSNYGNGSNAGSWGAERAIDGMMTTEWSSNGDGDAAFLELDLGQPRSVQLLGFRSRKMSDGTSIVRSFQLSIDGAMTLGPFETPDPDVRYVIELPDAITMQHVRMSAVKTSGGNTGLKELQLFIP